MTANSRQFYLALCDLGLMLIYKRHFLTRFSVASPLLNDGQPDIAMYNKELEKLGNPSWYNLPWLYAECYLYRYNSTWITSLATKLSKGLQ